MKKKWAVLMDLLAAMLPALVLIAAIDYCAWSERWI